MSKNGISGLQTRAAQAQFIAAKNKFVVFGLLCVFI